MFGSICEAHGYWAVYNDPDGTADAIPVVLWMVERLPDKDYDQVVGVVEMGDGLGLGSAEMMTNFNSYQKADTAGEAVHSAGYTTP